LNLSRLAWLQDGKACGTPAYVAPEFDVNGVGELDEKSDVFSMALVLALVWHDIGQGQHFDSYVMVNPIEERDDCGWDIKFDIGAGIVGLDDETKLELTNLLISMTKKDKALRIDLQGAIKKLEDIYLKHKCKVIPAEHHASVNDAIRIARAARVALHDVHGNAMDTWAIKLLVDELKKQIELLTDNGYAIHEFVNALGVTAFHSVKTKRALLEKTDEIFENFASASRQIERLRQNLRDLFGVIGGENSLPDEKAHRLRLLSEQIAHLSVCENKVAKSVLTFDCAVTESQRLLKKVANVQRALDGFDELKPALGVLARLKAY